MKDRKLYVGYSSDLRRRLGEHLDGHAASTRDRRPLKLIYYEAYLDQAEAKRREMYLKGGNGRAQLKIQLSLSLKKFNYKHLSIKKSS